MTRQGCEGVGARLITVQGLAPTDGWAMTSNVSSIVSMTLHFIIWIANLLFWCSFLPKAFQSSRPFSWRQRLMGLKKSVSKKVARQTDLLHSPLFPLKDQTTFLPTAAPDCPAPRLCSQWSRHVLMQWDTCPLLKDLYLPYNCFSLEGCRGDGLSDHRRR